jgi:hypothetical protein
MMIWTSPADDSLPRSGYEAMIRLVNNPNPSMIDIQRAKPNSWNPITKLDISHSVLKALGRPMAHAQLLNRVPPRSMTIHERKAMWQGDHQAFGRMVVACADQINIERRQEGKREIKTIHLFGAGITQRTLSAARYIYEEQGHYQLGGVACLNTVLKSGLLKMGKDHLTQATVNEASQVPIPQDHVRVEKFQLRHDIDGRGSEPTRFIRQAQPLRDISYLIAMRQPDSTIRDIDLLLDNGVPLRFIRGLNTAMAINTLHLIPVNNPLLNLSTIVGIEGQKVGMGINEHPGVVAVSAALGVDDYDRIGRMFDS